MSNLAETSAAAHERVMLGYVHAIRAKESKIQDMSASLIGLSARKMVFQSRGTPDECMQADQALRDRVLEIEQQRGKLTELRCGLEQAIADSMAAAKDREATHAPIPAPAAASPSLRSPILAAVHGRPQIELPEMRERLAAIERRNKGYLSPANSAAPARHNSGKAAVFAAAFGRPPADDAELESVLASAQRDYVPEPLPGDRTLFGKLINNMNSPTSSLISLARATRS